MTTDDDAVAEHLLRRLPRIPAAAAPYPACPDDNLLAAFAEGRLSEEAAAALEPHLATCERCRGDVALLAPELESQGDAVPVAPTGRLLSFRAKIAIAAAAGLLVALGLALTRPWERTSGLDAGDSEAALLAAAADIPGFSPVLHAERTSAASGAERGSFALGLPAGSTRATRPTFSWLRVPGAAAYDVSLVRADGTVAWTRRAASTMLPFPSGEPALVAGSAWTWTVRGRAARARPASRSFQVRADHGVGVDRVFDGASETRIGDLVRAQALARAGFLDEAEISLTLHLSAFPDDVAARETLDWMRRGLGLPLGGGTRLLDGGSGR